MIDRGIEELQSNQDRRSPLWPSASSAVVGVIGDPIKHSLSPRLHNAAFDALGLDWVSVAFEVKQGDARRACYGLRALGIAGVSVTMPHKEAVASEMDELIGASVDLQSVNCVVRRGQTLEGHSTDGAGFIAALRKGADFDPAGRSCVVFGAGGAAKAVILALTVAGAAKVTVVNRTASRAEEAAGLAGVVGEVGSAQSVSDADLVVQATPVGMTGVAEGVAFNPDLIRKGQVVADLVVHPLETDLLNHARSKGAQVVNGLGMLVHQAALALELWTGLAPPVEAMWGAAGVESNRR